MKLIIICYLASIEQPNDQCQVRFLALNIYYTLLVIIVRILNCQGKITFQSQTVTNVCPLWLIVILLQEFWSSFCSLKRLRTLLTRIFLRLRNDSNKRHISYHAHGHSWLNATHTYMTTRIIFLEKITLLGKEVRPLLSCFISASRQILQQL